MISQESLLQRKRSQDFIYSIFFKSNPIQYILNYLHVICTFLMTAFFFLVRGKEKRSHTTVGRSAIRSDSGIQGETTLTHGEKSNAPENHKTTDLEAGRYLKTCVTAGRDRKDYPHRATLHPVAFIFCSPVHLLWTHLSPRTPRRWSCRGHPGTAAP